MIIKVKIYLHTSGYKIAERFCSANELYLKLCKKLRISSNYITLMMCFIHSFNLHWCHNKYYTKQKTCYMRAMVQKNSKMTASSPHYLCLYIISSSWLWMETVNMIITPIIITLYGKTKIILGRPDLTVLALK